MRFTLLWYGDTIWHVVQKTKHRPQARSLSLAHQCAVLARLSRTIFSSDHPESALSESSEARSKTAAAQSPEAAGHASVPGICNSLVPADINREAEMYSSKSAKGSHQPWTLADIPYHRVQRDRIAGNEDLFYLLVGASLIEIASDLYAGNLIDYFQGDTDVHDWIESHWQTEEIQHGESLKRYVTTVWPDFDWEQAYTGFRADYAGYCRPDALGPTPGLEMAARCVVETGTATLYTMINRIAPEPVLRDLALHIRNDEVRHYKHFLHHFRRYNSRHPETRLTVLRTLWARAAEVDSEDASIAFRHIFSACHTDRGFQDDDYRAYWRRNGETVRGAYPYAMAVNMWLKPLDLNPWVRRIAGPVLARGARRFTPH